MINLYQYKDEEREIIIRFTDGSWIKGHIESVDDEEESELGEVGISFYPDTGGYMEIGQSEIERIEVL